MKGKLVIIIVLFGMLSCSSKTSINNNATIIVKYVDLNITTVVGVSCEGFDSAFISEIKEVVINKNSHDFHVIDSLLRFFSDDTSINSIDVRVKIIANAQKDSVICMDGMGQFFSVSKNKYMKNESLKNYILKTIYKQSE